MSRNKVNRAQNRGKSGKLTAKNADHLQAGVDRLIAELGIQPSPPYEEPVKEDGFGMAEVLAGFGLFAMVGLLNMYYI